MISNFLVSVSACYQIRLPAIVRTIPYLDIWWLHVPAAAVNNYINIGNALGEKNQVAR